MTVSELIKLLEDIEDKNIEVCIASEALVEPVKTINIDHDGEWLNGKWVYNGKKRLLIDSWNP